MNINRKVVSDFLADANCGQMTSSRTVGAQFHTIDYGHRQNNFQGAANNLVGETLLFYFSIVIAGISRSLSLHSYVCQEKLCVC